MDLRVRLIQGGNRDRRRFLRFSILAPLHREMEKCPSDPVFPRFSGFPFEHIDICASFFGLL
jgi:hypothetical protein